jgi:uncharacterized protein YjiS (DUF1127 family)
MITQKIFSHEDVQRYLTTVRHDRARVEAAAVYAIGRQVSRLAAAALRMVVDRACRTVGSRRRARRCADTRRTLSRLPDHILKDIGIDRSEIISVANEVCGVVVARFSAVEDGAKADVINA